MTGTATRTFRSNRLTKQQLCTCITIAVNFVAVTAREIFPVGEERLRDEPKERLQSRLRYVLITPKKSDD